MSGAKSPPSVLSLAELLTDRPAPEPCLIEPGLLPSQGILFIGGEPKAGKSLLTANLALALAAGGTEEEPEGENQSEAGSKARVREGKGAA